MAVIVSAAVSQSNARLPDSISCSTTSPRTSSGAM
jgi:hypothetical protein